ncbi:hypothetical protein CMO88_03710 [Candidatus Woesearchaeota archaeon]|nr:hypothetical protein [Candidatus Woesearchaeota archaeon]|tara:strand:+ start:9269 stop:9487 length:219 start_codon:yes stop_codon:yes gene_type:complete
MKLKTEILSENLYEINSLISLYRNYAKSFPQETEDIKSSQKEMKIIKEKILKQLLDLKKIVKKLELEVVPKN